MERKIVVTGIGILSPYGRGREAFWQGLRREQSVFKPITKDTAIIKEFGRPRMWGQVEDFKAGHFDLLLSRANRYCQLSFVAATEAIKDAKLRINNENSFRVGVIVGTALGHPVVHQYADMMDSIKAQYIYFNAATSIIAIKHGIKGIILTTTTAETSGSQALELAFNLIRWGRLDSAIVGGSEILSRMSFLSYFQLGELSPGDEEDEKCMPFSRHRNGTILSEGSVFVVLEEENCALKRKAHIYGEIASAASCYHPDIVLNSTGSEYVKSSMKAAVNKAKLEAQDIDLIYAAANGGKQFDKTEGLAIEDFIRVGNKDVPVVSIKSMIGETRGASGAFNVAAALSVLNDKSSTISKTDANKECEFDFNLVGHPADPSKINTVLCNAVSYYGDSSSVIVRRHSK